MSKNAPTPLQQAKDDFVTQWGAMGSSWGINRTMAQIHALLMISPQALTTDEIMEELRISRGNANMNLRELAGWGLIRGIVRKGERKEYFEAEKDVWKIFCTVVRERKRREIEPALEVLVRCREETKGMTGADAAAFQKQLAELADFVGMASKVMDKVAAGSQSKLLPLALKVLK
jgi:DNA-binding transcriptional regulator GbsR (MarR family)